MVAVTVARRSIILTGAGSGGHITPILAVAAEIKHSDANTQVIYIGQKGDKMGELVAGNTNIDTICSVRAGKFRRYHAEGIKQLFDLATLFKNVRDGFYVLIGFWQSRQLLKRLKPDIIFIKGGYVGVPVGLAAASLKIPFITHDSDMVPGLANRIIARWAKIHAVAMPAEVYNYPREFTVTTGIPLQAEYKPVTLALKEEYRDGLKLSQDDKVLLIVGGGLGSSSINQAVADIAPHLLRSINNLVIFHGVGRANLKIMEKQYSEQLDPAERGRLKVFGYVNDLYRYSAAADLIITRAGATNLAEFAVQGRACIIVPSPFLTGGHQLKNAEYFADHEAAAVLSQADLLADPNRLASMVSRLINDPKALKAMERAISSFAKPDSTKILTDLILQQSSKVYTDNEAA